MRLERRARPRVDSRHLLLLKGFLVWTVVGVAVLAAWHYGLLQQVWRADSTGLAIAITLVFAGTATRGSWHVLHLSRALNHVADVEQYVERRGSLAFRSGAELPGPRPDFPEGCVAEHVRHLRQKRPRSVTGAAASTRVCSSTRSRPICAAARSSAGSSPICCSRSGCSAR